MVFVVWFWPEVLICGGYGVAMVVIGLAVAGGGYWFVGFVGLFMVVLPSKKEKETGKERDGRKGEKKVK